jgi:hypothetical protein
VKAKSKMLKEALGRKREHTQYRAAAAHNHKVMLTEFPKVTLRMYDQALLVHVLDLLAQGILLDGSGWFLEAFNQVWKISGSLTETRGQQQNKKVTGKR